MTGVENGSALSSPPLETDSMDNVQRRSGRTTKQMAEAPQFAIYVWCNEDLDYPVKIMRRLGRKDLRIVSTVQDISRTS
jgi:hypothetical protein